MSIIHFMTTINIVKIIDKLKFMLLYKYWKNPSILNNFIKS